MKKIILSIVITFSIVSNLYSMYENNNNNNNRQCPQLPREVWKNEIASKFINQIVKADTLPKLKASVKGFLKFSSLNKECNNISKEIINEFKLNGKKITLKKLYDHKKNEIIQRIREKLEPTYPYTSFGWLKDINSKATDNGWTALMYAVNKGQKDIVELLIKNSAKKDIQNDFGSTALIIAVLNGHMQMVELLINNNANTNIRNKKGNTALMITIDKDDKEMAELLIKSKTKLDIQNSDGRTALMIAIDKGHKEIAKLLIENGAKLNIQDYKRWTALTIALD